MKRGIALLVVAGLVWACGESEFIPKDSSETKGTGGGNTRGGSSSRGGNSGTTAPEGECGSLWKDYLSALDAARVCDPEGGEAACNAEWVMPGNCNCEILVVPNTEAYDEALTRFVTFENAGCEIALCDMMCPGDPSGEKAPQCLVGGGVPQGVTTCQW